MPHLPAPEDVLRFWFEETAPKKRFNGGAAFDEEVRRRFGDALGAAERCELYAWRATPEGRLAEVIVLDQFSRNLRRETAGAFANDPLALALAQEAVQAGFDRLFPPERRAFLLMPYMHSESRLIQTLSVVVFAAPGLEDNLAFAQRHKAAIDRFGRFPHRNAALGRISTPEEEAFLQTPGARF
jgi:uncharacterized protein (DUF924 family)